MSTCFHCGLPVPETQQVPALEVDGQPRAFCCHGCRAVCKAIIDAGLADYYQHRTEQAVTANQQVLPDFLEQLTLYDRPEIQQGFVSTQNEWSEATLLLENIRCPACLWLNEKHLRSLPGIIDVHIDDITQRARVRWQTESIRLSQILGAIADIGYIAHPYDASRNALLQKLRRRRSTERLIFAGAVGMLVMNFSLASYFMADTTAATGLPLWVSIGRWTSLVLATLLLAYPGQEFFAGAWGDLRNRRLGMDIPVVLGLVFAYAGSLHATLSGSGDVYYDSIAMFVFLLLLARRYELGGKLRAANHLDRLSRFTPRTAQRIESDGSREATAIEALLPGDLISLVPGETVPVDGTISRGSSSFDESLITGEAHPVLKQHGDHVVAGSVNGEQPVVLRVTRTLQSSTLSEIQQLVERGLEQRPRYAVLAEQAAGWFVAAILVIAVSTAGYWLQNDPDVWLPNTIAVLIVTCPCALALATPVALAVSAGRFMELGVLPLRMRSLDDLAGSDTFVFDKTGTLTQGRPALSKVYPVGDLGHDQCLAYASALSRDSEHPLAKAVQSSTADGGTEPASLTNVPGAGVIAQIDGREWRLGKAGFVLQGNELTGDTASLLEACSDRGELVSLLANPDGVQAVLSFDDPVRPGVGDMLARLLKSRVSHLVVLSGDARRNVSRLCEHLGISECHADMSPHDKLAFTQSRQRQGHRIAMFGDGINDAPTLAAADVSVSFSDATDLANVSSDFILLGDDPRSLSLARTLARKTRKNILQNFAWAGGYNLIAVPFAAAGYIPPWGAAIGMSLSSLIVVMNALRLQSANIDRSN
ncbi:MAG: heavy metal translocating P-type ATPase [Thiotrichales bacterium]|nr:MAG: heavy metal translocating P-type ATPase [Thiotrichales bacterium]